jgi:2-keto-4-pentenoate hydratase
LILRSPAELAAASFHSLALECEFAFRLGRDLPVRDAPYGRDELMGAVAAVVPAVEVISPRLNSLTDYGVGAVIADCGFNGALILGPETAHWQELALDEQPVRLLIDGAQKAAGTGAAVLGHPLNALIWFVNRRNERGLGLHAGEVVTTGTCTGLAPAAAGQTALADFGDLGQVSVRFRG